MVDGILRKIQYLKKSEITLTESNATPEAKEVIAMANNDEVLALRIKINSPVFIEAAAHLTKEGIREVCNLN